MKIPKSWLNEYVKVSDISNSELEGKLFSSGFEVEEIIEINKNAEKIVVCRIEHKERHPDAEKLFVCQVNAGKFGNLQIITNADNISVGDLVPVVLDGGRLADGTSIKRGKLRGIESQGMFCGGAEIGITDEYYAGADSDGVLVFHDQFELGADVCELLGVKETVFDISVTANRPDCQSILGIAREVSAILKRPLKMPNLSYKTTKVNCSDKISVEVLNAELCPRYMAGFVYGIEIKPSPRWLQKRLALMGIRSINNIVDITNYVLIEIGQPMHAFDYRNLLGNKIVIRRANSDEKITTLDKKEFCLNDSHLVICDGEKPSALAGIMGGLGSGIKDDTTEIIFEAAKFKRDNIRKTSRSLNQRSDSSQRFEKGVDAYTTAIGFSRALALIDELEAGKIADGSLDENYSDLSRHIVKCSFSKINKLLGIVIPPQIICAILSGLGFECAIDGDDLTVLPPLFREDIEGYPDICEEIIRMYGYEHIKAKFLESAQITAGGLNDGQAKESELKRRLAQNSFFEIITYSFISPKDYENLGINTSDVKLVKLFNPLGEDISIMRTTLMPSMLNAISKNLNRKNLCARLFELAKVYLPKTVPLIDLPDEKLILSMGIFGDNESFFTLKGEIEDLLEALKYSKKIRLEECDKSFMHPARSAYIINEDSEIIGYFGEIHPSYLQNFEIDKRVYAAELDYTLISKNLDRAIRYRGYSKYPHIERDLALACDKAIKNAEVIDIILSAKISNLVDLRLFDVYEGDRIEKGKKSLAYRLVFESIEKTLDVSEVDGYIKKILKKLSERGITLR